MQSNVQAMYVSVGNEVQYENNTQLYHNNTQPVDYETFKQKTCLIHTTCVDLCPERCTRLYLEIRNQLLLKGANVSVCVLHGEMNDTKKVCTQLDLTSTTG